MVIYEKILEATILLKKYYIMLRNKLKLILNTKQANENEIFFFKKKE